MPCVRVHSGSPNRMARALSHRVGQYGPHARSAQATHFFVCIALIPRVVVDSWAVIALLKAEPPAARWVHEVVEAARAGEARLIIRTSNLGEHWRQTPLC